MSLGSIVVRLSMQTADFETDAGRAAKVAQRRAKEIDSAFTRAGKVIGAALGGAAIAVGVAVKSAIDHADKLNDMNQRLGVSAEALSGWGYAAKQTGTDIDALGIGLKKLAKNMAEALDPKSSQAKLFQELGVSVVDASGKLRDVESVLPEIATKFKELDNATLESALVMDLFGRSSAELLEFLNLGGDGLDDLRDRARALGVEISGDTMRAADQFNDTLGDIKTIGEGLALKLAEALLPALQGAAGMMRDGAQAGGEFGGIFDYIGERASAAVADLAAFAADVRKLDAMMEAAFKPRGGPALEQWKKNHMFDNVVGGVKSGPQSGQLARKGVDAAFDFLKQPAPSDLERRLNRAYGGTPSKSKSAKPRKEELSEEQKAMQRLNEEAKRDLENMRERLGLMGLETEAARMRWQTEEGAYKALDPLQKQKLVAMAEEIDARRMVLDLAEKAKRDAAQIEENYKRSIDDIRTERDMLGMSADQQEIYNRLKWAGVDANSAFGRSIIEETELLQQQRRAMNDQIMLMDQFRSGAADALTDFVTGAKSAEDALKDFFDSMAQMMVRMIAERWMEKLFGAQGSNGAGTPGGGWLASLAGALFGKGFSVGGYTGPGGVQQPAGIVHRGEVVWSQGDIARAGGVAAVEAMRRGGNRSRPAIINVNVPRNTSYETAAQAGSAAYAGASRAARRNN